MGEAGLILGIWGAKAKYFKGVDGNRLEIWGDKCIFWEQRLPWGSILHLYSCTLHNSVTVWELFMQFVEICIRSRRCVSHQNDCSCFLSF